jgi:predicted dehydrogenase
VATSNRYVLDAANGATMLTVSAGHQLDGVTMVLGELATLTATVATRRPRVRDRETGDWLAMTGPDQVAVTGELDSGAIAAIHVRGGTSRGTNFHWEINGTDGDLVVSSATGLLQFGRIRGGRGEDASLADLAVPDAYRRVPALAGHQDGVAYAVAHAYVQLQDDLVDGTTVTPDFDHAVRRHRMIDAIEQAAVTGRRRPGA